MKEILYNLLCKLLWYISDDAIGCTNEFDYEYENVPKELKDVMFKSNTFHLYKSKDRKKVLKWLNK